MAMMRVIVGMTGATGVIYGVRLLERLREAGVENNTARSRRRIQNAHDPNYGKQLDGALLT